MTIASLLNAPLVKLLHFQEEVVTAFQVAVFFRPLAAHLPRLEDERRFRAHAGRAQVRQEVFDKEARPVTRDRPGVRLAVELRSSFC